MRCIRRTRKVIAQERGNLWMDSGQTQDPGYRGLIRVQEMLCEEAIGWEPSRCCGTKTSMRSKVPFV